jgi:hypothetical protein
MRLVSPQRLIGLGLGVLAAVLLLVAAAGCHSTSYGDGIDAPALENQLKRIVAWQLLGEQFYNRTVDVACVGAGDALHFTCHVDAKNPGLATQSWDVQVACNPPGDDNTPRCVTPDGDALQ